ncbi:AraC family transcriptional regulator [Paucibacter sp. APW11]|uniref:AraC family transcriptional regulator n=1 Tax=Roseateles aquae TaxID=3077235 RepID=A0ABU3P959_9BURK|nr:AraC family transcriptional regulator [Paucibacter sp. APW11]MDT8999117.1 AraC family transcriptional regulator [Paucibacter sp. APW11]
MTSSNLSQALPSHVAGLFGLRMQSSHCFPRHSHDVYGIGLIEQGGQRSGSGRGPVQACAGQLVSVNPGEVHDGVALDERGRRWTMFYLEPALLAELCSDLQQKPALPELLTPPVFDACPARHGLLRLLDSCVSAAAAPMAQEAALLELLAALLPLAGRRLAPASADPCMREVRDRLHAHMLEAPSLARLATDSGMSRFQLLRGFTRCYGLPPHAYLQQLRLAHARRAIAAGSSLVEAALCSGFADQAHLSRLFKRCYGLSPGAYRRAQR